MYTYKFNIIKFKKKLRHDEYKHFYYSINGNF